jgi:RNA polymerase sigma-54 factor
MAITTKLEFRQGQQLVMTPQLQQAIRLLQYSNQELAQFIEGELERNPLLEVEEASPETSGPAEADATELADAASAAGESESGEEWLDLEKPATADAIDTFDTEFENVFPEVPQVEIGPEFSSSQWSEARQRGSSFEDQPADFEAYATSEISLREHLEKQASLALTNSAERLVAQYLIDTVDEAGYLHADLVAVEAKLAAPEGMAERVLAVLQSFEPTGVCARSLSECLALQLKEQNRYDPQIAAVLDNLELMATHNLAALRRAVGVEPDVLAEMLCEIR